MFLIFIFDLQHLHSLSTWQLKPLWLIQSSPTQNQNPRERNNTSLSIESVFCRDVDWSVDDD